MSSGAAVTCHEIALQPVMRRMLFAVNEAASLLASRVNVAYWFLARFAFDLGNVTGTSRKGSISCAFPFQRRAQCQSVSPSIRPQ